MTTRSFTQSATTPFTAFTAPAPDTRTARPGDATESAITLARQAALSAHLQAQLLALPFAAFARCVADLLDALGYADVQLAGRLDWRGRNKDGGYDLSAGIPSGLAPRRRVIIQVKQFGPDMLVHQRNVDELRGACLRAIAAEGLLVTTSGFSRVVQDQQALMAAASGMVPLAPVHLVDGPALTRALTLHRIGVRDDGKNGTVLDEVYFARLAQACTPADNGRSGGRGSGRPTSVPARQPSSDIPGSQPCPEFGATLTLRLDFASAPAPDSDPAVPGQNVRSAGRR